MKLVPQYMALFFTFSPTSNHLHPLQVENCDSNSRLVVDEMTMVKSGSKRLIVNVNTHIDKLSKRTTLSQSSLY